MSDTAAERVAAVLGRAGLYVVDPYCVLIGELIKAARYTEPANECSEKILAQMGRDDRTLELGELYRAACLAMPPLWLAVLKAYPPTEPRRLAVAAHTAGRQRCQETREALFRHLSGGVDETGCTRE